MLHLVDCVSFSKTCNRQICYINNDVQHLYKVCTRITIDQPSHYVDYLIGTFQTDDDVGTWEPGLIAPPVSDIPPLS